MLRGDAHFVDSWFPLMQDQRQPQPGRGRGGSDRRSGCGGSRRSRGRCRRGGGRRSRCRRGGVPRRGSDRCGALDAVAVGVVQERRQRRRSLLHLGQAVFVVEDEGVRRPGDGAGRLVAIAVVAVRVAIGARHGVFVGCIAVGVGVSSVAGQVISYLPTTIMEQDVPQSISSFVRRYLESPGSIRLLAYPVSECAE